MMSCGISVIFLIGWLCSISISRAQITSAIPADCSKCGMTEFRKRTEFIVGGKAVKDRRYYPWMVSLMKGKHKICGGAIISDSYILTAAHCVAEDNTYLEIGFLTSDKEVEIGPKIEKIIPHPFYNTHPLLHDIALIKLQERIKCGTFKNPVCLPPAAARLLPETEMLITGWGVTKSGKLLQIPYELQEAKVRSVDYEKCTKKYPPCVPRFRDHFLCVMGVNHTTACFGDSGGPLILYHKKYFTMGVTSFGDTVCHVDNPIVFASASRDLQWITEITGVQPEKF